MFGGPCLDSDPGGKGRTHRAVMAALLAAAGALAGGHAPPLLASRSSQEQARPEQPPPPKPAQPRPGEPTSKDGSDFFVSRETSPARIACADCHLITKPGVPPSDDLIRAGHSLYGAFGRGTWWNGRIFTDCGEAAELCFRRYMGGEEFDGRTRTALVLFMKSQSPPATNPWILHKVPPGRTEVSQGDAARGRDLFRRACALCHGAGAAAASGDPSTSKMTPREIADLIRTGKERMPLFQGDILSDAEVADLAAYTYSLQPKTD